MKEIKYIHYGSETFDRDLMRPIKNLELFIKPEGGLWASRVETAFGWKEWCNSADYRVDKLRQSFVFKLKSNTHVLRIVQAEDLEGLPHITPKIPIAMWDILDFEKLSEDYDALEVFISNDWRLRERLCGWDCDSILVMNRDVVIPVEK